jgi:hypothetical protein
VNIARFVLGAAILGAASCGNTPAGPTASEPLPFVSESASMRYHYEPGDAVEVARQEIFNAWALERLGITVPRKIEYRKYRSRADMGRYTGNSSTNGFAEPEQFRFHTIWPWDNHEVVHVYTAVIGRPSDFFNEGIAVSFQTDPVNQNFNVIFNGVQVHDAARGYLRAGTLPQPISRYVTSNAFRGIQNLDLSYRVAGSFVLHMTERFGLPAVLQFFRGVNNREESLESIRARMLSVFGVSLEDVEATWLATLRQ